MHWRKTITEALTKEVGQTLAFLAPMAGYSDLPYRSIVAKEGSALQVTELVSATGIRFSGLEKSWRYLAIDPEREGKVQIQLFGADPDDFLYAVEAILKNERLNKAWGIDINMGCPVPKVVKNGAGSALMDRPEIAAKIVSSLRPMLEGEGKILSVKIRRGFKAEIENAPEFAVLMAKSGTQMITVHGRFREQYYAGEASHEAIARVESALVTEGLREGVFFVSNGDIVDFASAKDSLTMTKADAVAIGRAAQGNPWLFRAFIPSALGLPSDDEKKKDILQHAESYLDFIGEEHGILEFRKILVRYAQGREHAKQLRAKASHIQSLDDVRTWLTLF